MPHSTLSQPFQRPERGSSPGATLVVQGEQPIEGVSHESLVKGLINHGHRSARAIDGLPSLAAEIRNSVRTGDEIVVCLGAGDITSYANSLADDLKKL